MFVVRARFLLGGGAMPASVPVVLVVLVDEDSPVGDFFWGAVLFSFVSDISTRITRLVARGLVAAVVVPVVVEAAPR